MRIAIPGACAIVLTFLNSAAVADEDPVGLLELNNYYEYSTALLSSGQPTADQFAAIRAAGVEAIINLAPVDAPGALADEGDIVRELGMRYTHIPVDWEAPPLADVERFLSAMETYAGQRVLVHCYANARASAFVYLYRVLRAGHNREVARAALVSIWDMNPGYEWHKVDHWRALVAEALDTIN